MTGTEGSGAIDIDGRRLAWRSVGSGPVLVLLNGYSATAQDWNPALLGELASAFTVICPDSRGLGESELGDPGSAASIDALADDLERVLDAIGAPRAPVAGWSMGGFVAQRLAVRSPERVEALVLIASDPGGSAAVRATPEDWAELTDFTGTPREQASRVIPLLFPPAFVPVIDEAFGDLIAEARAKLAPDALVAQQRAMAAWHANDQVRPGVDAAPPVLVMTGTEDVIIPPENADVLAAIWPTCEVERFEGCGHAFFALEPQRTAARITSFCAR